MSRQEKIQGVRGMNDILPDDEALWQRFEEAVGDCMRGYGYRRIRTPILEHTRLFVRASARSPTSSRRKCIRSPMR